MIAQAALLLALAQAPRPEASWLVARLGHPRYAERQRAQLALLELPDCVARPAVLRGREHPDPEVAARCGKAPCPHCGGTRDCPAYPPDFPGGPPHSCGDCLVAIARNQGLGVRAPSGRCRVCLADDPHYREPD